MIGKTFTSTKKKYSAGELLDDIYAERYKVIKCLGYCRIIKCYKYEVEIVENN